MSLRTVARAAANPVASLAVAIALVGGTGVASAATGGNFILGRSNSASTKTALVNSTGTALALVSKTGTPPLAVSNSTKVSKLNSDLLDGLDSAALQRRVTGTCAGGAVSAIGSTGTVTCAALPKKINVSLPFGTEPSPAHTVVATADGVTLSVACEVYDVNSMEGPRLRMTAYFNGAGIVNGHTTTTPYTGDTTVEGVGHGLPAAGTSASLRVLDAAELAVSRQSAVLMVVSGAKLSQWTLHLFADGRAFGTPGGTPCTVWGTIV